MNAANKLEANTLEAKKQEANTLEAKQDELEQLFLQIK